MKQNCFELFVNYIYTVKISRTSLDTTFRYICSLATIRKSEPNYADVGLVCFFSGISIVFVY